jgi:hypothetical protein
LSLLVLGTLASSGSDLLVALPLISPLHMNGQVAPQASLPTSGAVFGDFQLVDGHVEAKAELKSTYTASSCFPALDFVMPSDPPANLDNWWCNPTDEYAFLGFSFEVTACELIVAFVYRLRSSTNVCFPGQNKSRLQKEFADIRKNFNSRYVRLYGACDNDGFYDAVVDAAWDNGLGVHALVWVSILAPLSRLRVQHDYFIVWVPWWNHLENTSR